MEVAGLVLGALPVAVSVMDSYKRCLKTRKRFNFYEDDILNFRAELAIQQTQLELTLREIELVNPTKAQLHERICAWYPDKAEHFIRYIEQMEKLLSDMMSKLDVDLNGRPRWTQEPPERARWEWRRVNHAINADYRESLISKLQASNHALSRCIESGGKRELPLSNSASDASSPTLAAIQERFDARQCAARRTTAEEVHRAAVSAWKCSQHSHRGNLRLSWHNSDVATSSQDMIIALSSPTSEAGSVVSMVQDDWCEVHFAIDPDLEDSLDLEDPVSSVVFSRLGSDSSMTTISEKDSLYNSNSSTSSSRARVADKTPSSDETKQRSEIVQSETTKKWYKMFRPTKRTAHVGVDVEFPNPELQQTQLCDEKITENNDQTQESSQPQDVSCLCSFLRDATLDFGRLDCGAKVLKKGREGNKAKYAQVKAVPIRDILATDVKKQRSNRFCPGAVLCSRKDRYAMAAAATWAVLYLAETPWLLPDWNGKEQLQLIQRQESPGGAFATISTLLREPGRKNLCRDMSPPLPTWHSGSVRNGTLFALGILLIELGLNKPFEQLRDECIRDSLEGQLGEGTKTPLTDADVADILVDQVYEDVSEWYGYAVQRCLRFEFPGRDVTKSFQFDQFRHHFFLYVVAPVQATFALLPSSCSLL
ncbi:hypothetical protein MCOR25_005619 [Pyricularia grisea]|uniref:Uncharacterized protein n=1 Tax=Pyricularia grisea TaxID=148305 RepID=A0A6P8B2D5_PYRGI|nr:uncharacterized protein PgNI_07774 [Pyricularia grisea]KAI6364614.1 hypothetical protein MCOR25_005619 [Pyricularia grisea]TLD09065.1 hypothetical protein PgNI_07774 [Pyricularia grisea]